MKFRKLVWIFGFSMALMLAGACTGASGGEQAQENEATEETPAQEEPAGENTEEETADGAAEENIEQDGNSGGIVSDAPVRIYGTITEVGEDMLTVDNQSEVSTSGEIILNIDPENTVLVDAQTGFPVSLSDVGEGSFEAYLGPVMTMSLPPHTVPYVVVVNIPEDGTAPQYAVAAGDLIQEDGVYTLEATDGRTYTVPEDVEIVPFRTKNIVSLGDLTAGRGCLIWLDENETAVKLVLLEGVPGAETAEESGDASETDAQEEPAE